MPPYQAQKALRLSAIKERKILSKMLKVVILSPLSFSVDLASTVRITVLAGRKGTVCPNELLR